MKKCDFGPAGNSLSFYDEGHKSTSEVFEWLVSRNLDAYEYQAGKGLYASDDTLRTLGKAAKECGISVSLHAPYFISLSSLEDEKRIKSVKYIFMSAHACELLGGNVFVVHSGSAAKCDREEAMKKAEDTLYMAASSLEENGYTCRAGLETMGKLNQLGTLDEVLRLCKVSRKHYRPVVDFGHLNSRTLGGFRCKDDFKRVFDTVSKSLDPDEADMLHCHFSKIEYTKMGEKKHLTFEDEIFGPSYEDFIDAVAELGVHPTVICESDGTMAEDAFTMKKYYLSKSCLI